MRGRGLKQKGAIWESEGATVAPRAGAWIETMDEYYVAGQSVAPRAGAWIETNFQQEGGSGFDRIKNEDSFA